MDYRVILASVYESGIPHIVGGEEPSLSRPVLFKKSDKLYTVFMVYETVYEGYPAGFVFVDMDSLTSQYMSNDEAREFTDMPLSVFTEASHEGEDADYTPVDFEELFMSCIPDGRVDAGAYDAYLKEVVAHGTPLSRSFYSFFKI